MKRTLLLLAVLASPVLADDPPTGRIHGEEKKEEKKPEPAPAPKWQPYYEEASPGDSGVVVTPQFEQAQARRKAEAEAVRQATTAIQVPADQRARIALLQSRPIDTRFLDDLKRREQAMQKAASDPTPDSGERAKQLTNWAFDGGLHPDKITVPTPWGPTDGKPVEDVSKRKEKGVRMFVDAGELRSVLQKSEERALDMLEKMEKNLVRGGDGFSALRDLKHRVVGELGTGKAVVKLGFTKTPWAGVNETLIAVSLKNLMARPDSEEARTLGNLKRLVGYMLDPEGDDLVLLGVPGEKDGKPHLLLDDLTLMLGTVWRENARPGCTLDPSDAKDYGKDQIARVFGVPHQSNAARVMLDADYEMKKINFGLSRFDDDPIPGFVCNFDSALKRAKERADAGEKDTEGHQARFWLSPCRPEPGDMMVEPGRRFVMFQTRVQLMTEAMALSGDAIVGTGKVDPIDDKSARIFTAHMEEIEARRPIFRQLHALFDLEILCQILAENHVRSALLERIAARTVAPVSVLTRYASCKNEATVEGHNFTYTVQGGVTMYLKLRRKYIRDMEQKELRELETACLDAFCGRAVSIGDSAALKALLRDRQRIEKDRRTADLSFERGCGKYAAKDYEAAEKFLTEAIDRDPDFPEACTQRALTRLAVKNWKGAVADCDLALKKDPELWPAFQLRALARRELGDEKGCAADWAKFQELVRKDKFLQQMVADAATR
jgi:hypothetical protein